MDPLTISAGMSALGGALGGSAGPSSADAMFDHSGWNVNFGAGSIAADRRQGTAPIAGALDGYLPYVLVAAGVLIAWRMTRR